MKNLNLNNLINDLKVNNILNNANYRSYKFELVIKTQQYLTKWDPNTKIHFSDNYFQVIDFFSGCGGMSLGFAAINRIIPLFKIIGGCDINPDAAKSYKKNFNSPGIVQDITEFTDKKKLNDFLYNLPEYNKNKPLLLIGCPPCQGFTSHRKKSWDQKDIRNNLIENFAEIAIKLNPECVIMENVPEMLSKKYWNYYESAKKIFEKAGYVIHQQIYNAASFGVPQERYRTLVMAMKRDFLLPEPVLKKESYKTVKDAIGFLPPITPGEICIQDAYHYCANHKQSTLDVIRAVPKDGGNRPKGIGPKCLDKVKGFTDVYGRLSWNKPSITITQYSRNPASGRYTHPEQDRGLTIREASLLQSFPTNFQFVGNFDSIFKQIGEAVPPLFACAVAANVLIEIISMPLNKNDIKYQSSYITEPINNSYSAYSRLISEREKA